MKFLCAFVLASLAFNVHAQDKFNYVNFNKLTEVTGTHYVIASMSNMGKMYNSISRYLLFIDTKTGETTQVDFPNKGYFQSIEQVKIDSLGINRIVVSAHTVDLDGRKGIDWNDPMQILVLSADGKEKIQLTDSKLFVSTWVVNKQTGTITITGHYDTNNNHKYDKTDKHEIGIYDLKTLKLIRKI